MLQPKKPGKGKGKPCMKGIGKKPPAGGSKGKGRQILKRCQKENQKTSSDIEDKKDNTTKSKNFFSLTDTCTICLVLSLKDTLTNTAQLWHTDTMSLFITLIKPHKSVHTHTLAI